MLVATLAVLSDAGSAVLSDAGSDLTACVDAHEGCAYWASAGECRRNPSYMHESCSASCGVCSGSAVVSASVEANGAVSARASCSDEAGEKHCRMWALKGECESNPGFMLTSCAESCYSCQSERCGDETEECGRWAAQGECSRNEAYMVRSCPFSCRACWLNETEACIRAADTPPAAVAGTIDATFEALLGSPWRPTVLHREPWILHFADFLSADEADDLARLWAGKVGCPSHTAICRSRALRRARGSQVSPNCRRWAREPPSVSCRPGTRRVARLPAVTRARTVKIYASPGGSRTDPGVLLAATAVARSAACEHAGTLSDDVVGAPRNRTSTTSWCNVPSCLDAPEFTKIRGRISELVGIHWSHSEHLQMLKYEEGQYYRQHHDQISPRYAAWGPRLYTFFMYLNDVDEGGETRFTEIDVTVPPRKGSAILWPSVYSDDPFTTDMRTQHEALPVVRGRKFAANFWVHMFDFQHYHGSGCSNDNYRQHDAMEAVTRRYEEAAGRGDAHVTLPAVA